jgi:hypothetical protein
MCICVCPSLLLQSVIITNLHYIYIHTQTHRCARCHVTVVHFLKDERGCVQSYHPEIYIEGQVPFGKYNSKWKLCHKTPTHSHHTIHIYRTKTQTGTGPVASGPERMRWAAATATKSTNFTSISGVGKRGLYVGEECMYIYARVCLSHFVRCPESVAVESIRGEKHNSYL